MQHFPYLSLLVVLVTLSILTRCGSESRPKSDLEGPSVALAHQDSNLVYREYSRKSADRVISRSDYQKKLYGFWLGQCIANWTGLITEMDKIGGEGKDGKGAGFYTRANWGGPDQPNLWSNEISGLSPTIDFYFEDEGGVWGADDDTDIEYIYQYITYQNQTSILTGEQIREGWLTHIYSDKNSPFAHADGTKENYLWVSNQSAHDLMIQGMVPPETSDPRNNPNYEMIDAQLTTEIFGLFAPTRPDIALQLARLPIQTTARFNAQWAAEFYVCMYSLASYGDQNLSTKENLFWMANQARKRLPDDSYVAKMFDFVKNKYYTGSTWEETRDALYIRYQVNQEDGYDWSTREQACNGCFAAGINFGASIISLLYGEGDIKETIKIGALAGWDSDNPTATWGGLLGFMLGKEGVEQAFDRKFATKFNIHRTRGGFPNDGMDTFDNMAWLGVYVTDRVIQEEINGGVDLEKDVWYVPDAGIEIPEAEFDTGQEVQG